MKLVQCSRIPGNPRHRIETCLARKEKAKVLSKKESSAGWKHGTTGVTGDYFYNVCYDCDPKKMKTVKIDTSQLTAPITTKKLKKESVMVKKKELRATHKPKYVCKCGFGTDDPAKFIIEQGVCRKCYMKEYYIKNPRKGKVAEPAKKGTTGEGVLGKPKMAAERQTSDRYKRLFRIASEVKDIGRKTPRYKKGVLMGITVKATDVLEKPAPTADDVFGEIVMLMRGTVLLDFTEHPELLEFLEKISKTEFRTVNTQIMSILDRYHRTVKNA